MFVHSAFPCRWSAEILTARPPILPPRHFTYPAQVEEVERGALEVMARPEDAPPFLATFALGFRDPIVPTGVWSTPNPDELCALSGGYAYLVSVSQPQRFTMLPMRPVLAVHAAVEAGLLLFVGHRSIVAWGVQGKAWDADALSSEGITVESIAGAQLTGKGWDIRTDREFLFLLDLNTGQRLDAPSASPSDGGPPARSSALK
jgi:hypothetical protein